MGPALINENPVIHERKERSSRPQAADSDSAVDAIDAQEIFDILLCYILFQLHL